MEGSITNPIIKTDLKEVAETVADDLKQQAADFAKNKADSVKTTVQDSVSAIKTQWVKDLKEDLTKQLLGGKKDSTSSSENR